MKDDNSKGSASPPARCLLCDCAGTLRSARFHQLYPQRARPPVLLDWWECKVCDGWFVHPGPPIDVIHRYWETVTYNDANHESEVFRQKEFLLHDVVSELSRLTKPGRLLDFGSNYGRFLILAQSYGWEPYGFEPCQEAVEVARQYGFEVRSGWSLNEAEFPANYFDAVTAIDSFYYPEDPMATLKNFHRVLRPGGVLAMRVSNKRTVLGLIRLLTSEGFSRDRRLSTLLQAQFHSISISRLRLVLLSVGFDRVRIISRAITAPWSSLSIFTRLTYLTADLVRYLTFAKVNISPGVAVFARKSQS